VVKSGTTVVVTGAGGGGVGEGIVKALRLADGYRIVSTDINTLSPMLFHTDAGYLLPHAREQDYTERLLEVCHRENACAVIPGSEPELERISKDRQALIDAGVCPILGPSATIDIGQDKWLTYKFLRDHGFGTPFTAPLEGAYGSDFPMPAIIKPRIGGGGARSVFHVHSSSEFECVKNLFEIWEQPAIVQQYVGFPDTEYTLGVMTSRTGRTLSTVCLKRVLLGGASWRMETADLPELCNVAAQICQVMGVKGPANIQCRLDGAGKMWTFELNVRFSGTTPVRAVLGVNEPDMAVRDLVLGEDVAPVQAKQATAVMRGFQETYVPVALVTQFEAEGHIAAAGLSWPDPRARKEA
jgi:carbamoyl-phosphate synthase large subunit